MIKRVVLVWILLLLPMAGLRADSGSPWCGYALIEGVPGIATYLPMVSLIAPDSSSDSNPYQLFQTRISLDGTKAIIEACWKIYPTRDVILNLLSLGGIDVVLIDPLMTYSIFAPGQTRDESAASVRSFLHDHQSEWEPPCSEANFYAC